MSAPPHMQLAQEEEDGQGGKDIVGRLVEILGATSSVPHITTTLHALLLVCHGWAGWFMFIELKGIAH
jgi:hypothetical protein